MEEPSLFLPAPIPPKRAKFPFKIIGSVFGFLILTVGLGFGLLQVQRNQEIQKSSAAQVTVSTTTNVDQGIIDSCNNAAIAAGSSTGGKVRVAHYKCPGPISDYSGGCQLNGTILSFDSGIQNYSFDQAYCGTQQIDVSCQRRDNGLFVGGLLRWNSTEYFPSSCTPSATATPQPTTPPNSTPVPTQPPANTPQPTTPPVPTLLPPVCYVEAQSRVPSIPSLSSWARRNFTVPAGTPVEFRSLPSNSNNPGGSALFFSDPNGSGTPRGPFSYNWSGIAGSTDPLYAVASYQVTAFPFGGPPNCQDNFRITVTATTTIPTPTPTPTIVPTPTPTTVACLTNYTTVSQNPRVITFTASNPISGSLILQFGIEANHPTQWLFNSVAGTNVYWTISPSTGSYLNPGQQTINLIYNGITYSVCLILPAIPTPAPTSTIMPTNTPTPTPTPMAICQNVKVYRGTPLVEIPVSSIQQGNAITFRAFANATNTTISTIRFTVTIDNGAATTYDRTASLVGGVYQADLQLDITQAAIYTVTAQPI